MPVKSDVRTKLIRFLPYKVPEYADSDGWLYHAVNTRKEAFQWIARNDGLIEDAYFVASGEYLVYCGSTNSAKDKNRGDCVG